MKLHQMPACRKFCGKTPTDMAKAMGVAPVTVTNLETRMLTRHPWEKGDSFVLSTLARYVHALDSLAKLDILITMPGFEGRSVSFVESVVITNATARPRTAWWKFWKRQ